MGGAIPIAITAVGAGLGAGVGTAAAGTGSDGEEGAGQDEAGEDGTPGNANCEGPADEGIHTGRNRCPECRRRRELYCKHAQE